jgi:hypothetical protein
LHSFQSRTKVEDKVVPTFDQGTGDDNALVDGRCRDRQLGDGAFLIGGEHGLMVVVLPDNVFLSNKCRKPMKQ